MTLDPLSDLGRSPGVFRRGFARPTSRSVVDFKRKLTAIPKALVGTSAPESRAYLPQSDQYQENRSNYDKATVGMSEHEISVNVMYFRDHVNGGYSPVAVYNNGTGELIISGIISGTNVTTIRSDMNIIPNADGTYDIGTSSLRWAEGHFDDLYTDTLRVAAGSKITVYEDLVPSADSTWDLGAGSLYWKDLRVDRVYTARLESVEGLTPDEGISTNTYFSFEEITTPGVVANTGRLYSDDNGSGKTRLMVIFGSGAAQQIAIEP